MSRVRSYKHPTYPATPLREVAVLRWRPEDFAEQRDVVFVRGADSLDEYRWAAIKVDDQSFYLVKYEGSPDAGTELMAPADNASADALSLFLSGLDLDESIVTWRPEPTAAQPLIVEPANPYEFHQAKLVELIDRLRGLLPARNAPRLALRPEVGYGVTGWQAIRLWVPDEADDATRAEILDAAVSWLKAQWAEDFEAHGDRARTRSVSLFNDEGELIDGRVIRGSDGAVSRDRDTRGYRFPKPQPTDEPS